jgi:signal transduction histidine kinase
MDALSLSLRRELSAPSAARRAIEHRFDELSPERVAELALVVTELVSNAVKYGRGAITLKIHHDDEVVRGEVIDEGRGL